MALSRLRYSGVHDCLNPRLLLKSDCWIYPVAAIALWPVSGSQWLETDLQRRCPWFFCWPKPDNLTFITREIEGGSMRTEQLAISSRCSSPSPHAAPSRASADSGGDSGSGAGTPPTRSVTTARPSAETQWHLPFDNSCNDLATHQRFKPGTSAAHRASRE